MSEQTTQRAEQDNLEAALRESEELFSRVFHVGPTACAISAPEDGRHYDVNEGWMELLGYTREEALNNTAVSLGIWADPEERVRFVELLKKNGSVKALETKFRRKTGELIDVMVAAVFAEFHGEPRLFVVYDDITKRKRAEKLLAQQASAMKLMKSIAFTANQSTDVKSALSFCLEQICNYTGWDVGHVYLPDQSGSAIMDTGDCWYHSDEQKFGIFREISERHSSNRDGKRMCNRVFEQGEAHWVSDLASDPSFKRAQGAKRSGLNGGVAFPIKIRDEVVGVLEFYATKSIEPSTLLVNILTDVGTQMGRVVERADAEAKLVAHRDHLEEVVEARTAEIKCQAQKLEMALLKEKELNEMQRQFVSMASHEFRTPLAIIDSTAQRLKKRANCLTPEEAIDRVDKIRDTVKRMTRLMESALTAARMENGQIAIEIEPCNVEAIVRDACVHQEEIAKDHVIACNLTNLPEAIQADSGALEQVLTNLLSNAVKYAPEDPEIEVTARAEGSNVMVSVRDHGLGIDEDDLANMFERFFRAKTSTGIAGTGIGLSLVKALVEMHGGSIGVESEKGKGSIFTVLLPISGPDRAEQNASKVA